MKVYCNNCKHYRKLWCSFSEVGKCQNPTFITIEESWDKQYKVFALAETKNKNNNCSGFVPRRSIWKADLKKTKDFLNKEIKNVELRQDGRSAQKRS